MAQARGKHGWEALHPIACNGTRIQSGTAIVLSLPDVPGDDVARRQIRQWMHAGHQRAT